MNNLITKLIEDKKYQASEANQSSNGHLILFIKRVLVKKMLYSGNFNLGKDFGHGQNVKTCLFICVNELWVINDFFQNT